MDFLFLELYIQKKYNQKVEEYFKIGKQSVSDWRTKNKVPSQRLIEFYNIEGSLEILDLFKKAYNL